MRVRERGQDQSLFGDRSLPEAVWLQDGGSQVDLGSGRANVDDLDESMRFHVLWRPEAGKMGRRGRGRFEKSSFFCDGISRVGGLCGSTRIGLCNSGCLLIAYLP